MIDIWSLFWSKDYRAPTDRRKFYSQFVLAWVCWASSCLVSVVHLPPFVRFRGPGLACSAWVSRWASTADIPRGHHYGQLVQHRRDGDVHTRRILGRREGEDRVISDSVRIDRYWSERSWCLLPCAWGVYLNSLTAYGRDLWKEITWSFIHRRVLFVHFPLLVLFHKFILLVGNDLIFASIQTAFRDLDLFLFCPTHRCRGWCFIKDDFSNNVADDFTVVGTIFVKCRASSDGSHCWPGLSCKTAFIILPVLHHPISLSPVMMWFSSRLVGKVAVLFDEFLTLVYEMLLIIVGSCLC